MFITKVQRRVVMAMLFVFSCAVFGQEKPLIKVVATGGTIAHLADDSRIPFEEVIAHIRQNFPETHKLLDSVHIEVDNTIRVGSSSMTGQDVLK
ncbi:MAG: hypothetical protein HYX74_05930, partial [Acidobacteria bacterium]|nr:hypothetical protein [Acidobacteriota bacterium]